MDNFNVFYIVIISVMARIVSPSSIKNATTKVDKLLHKDVYDVRLRPNMTGGPVEVTTRMKILSIDSIDTVNMDFSLDMFFMQQWTDERLNHGENITVTINDKVLDKIWLPDTYFVNAKDSSFHYVTKDNRVLLIGPEGVINYRIRLSIKAVCRMDLRLFPMDKQMCPLFLESYGYSDRKVKYKWASTDGNKFLAGEKVKKLPQFTLKYVALTSKTNTYVAGKWSCLSMVFHFERMYSYFLIHVYGPCALIVMISWLSFLIPRGHTPARISLGITALLTTVTVLNMSNNSMPKVNYIKALDKYLIGCFMFVFSVLAEYAIILSINGKIKKLKQKQEHEKANLEESDEEQEMSAYTPLSAYVSPSPATKQYYNSTEAMHHKDWRKIIFETVFKEEFLTKIDEYARVGFPVAFAVFNALYFGTYL